MAEPSRGKLKLKGTSEVKDKLKKVKKTPLASQETRVASTAEQSTPGGKLQSERPKANRTPAEVRFEEARRKREEMHIKRQAAKSHKERVKEFNAHLGTLSEHYDIPKV